MQDAFSNLKGHVMEANRNPRGKLYNQVRRMIALTSAVKEMQSASSDIQKAFRGFQVRIVLAFYLQLFGCIPGIVDPAIRHGRM